MSMETYETEEICCFCGEEISVVFETDVQLPCRGLIVKCPNCGKDIILCSMCIEHGNCNECNNISVNVVSAFKTL